MLPQWAGDLARLYLFKRNCRKWDNACRLRLFRRIAREKKRLLDAGVPYIELHLVCRLLTDPQRQSFRDRLRYYYAQGRLFW